jgi:hypothetical protein
MEADLSKASTTRSLRGATATVAEGRTMITAVGNQTPGTVDAAAIAMTIAEEIAAVEATDEAAIAMMTDVVTTMVKLSVILTGTQELTPASQDQEVILNTTPSLGTTGVTITAMMRGEAATMEDSLSLTHMATPEPILDSQGHKEVIRNRATVDEMSIKAITRSKATAVVLTTTGHLARSTPALLATTTDLSSNLTSSTSRERVKSRTAHSTPSVLATWTKALESLIFAGKATPRMRSTLLCPKSCTFTANCSSSTTAL